jgi:hypothetical protein
VCVSSVFVCVRVCACVRPCARVRVYVCVRTCASCICVATEELGKYKDPGGFCTNNGGQFSIRSQKILS